MLLTHLFHIAIRSPNLTATRRFYTEVLGMQVADRPEMAFPGVWIKAATLGGDAILHFYGGWAAEDENRKVPLGTAAIDHVAIAAHGFYELRERLRKFGLSWRENKVPELPIWQIFVYDPSAVLLEISFDLKTENKPLPTISKSYRYKPRVNWFDEREYLQFSTAARPLARSRKSRAQ